MCTNSVNTLFSIDGVRPDNQRSIDKILAWISDSGHTKEYFATLMGVTKQVVTNWKKRGMPAVRLKKAAAVTGLSIEYLMGVKAKHNRQPREIINVWPFSDRVPFADYDNLDHDQKTEIAVLVEDRVKTFMARNGVRGRKKDSEAGL